MTSTKNKKNNNTSNDIARAVEQIEKDYGVGAIMRLGTEKKLKVPAISTGSFNLDHALGVGGIPKGRVTEIFGPESSGKTTLALQVVAHAQSKGGHAAYIDAEHAVDPEYAKQLGVDLQNLLISQPDAGEQALGIAELLVRSNSLDVIVIDSVAALVPQAELNGEMGDTHVGLQARMMSQALRKLTGVINKSQTALIFINQIREKIGVFFGNPETTPGGRALKFYSSVRIDIRRIGSIKSASGEIKGNKVRATCVKNKVAAPFRKAEFEILFNQGISREGEIIDKGIEHNIIAKSGSWLHYDGEQLGQGKEVARSYLIENPKIMKQIEKAVLSNMEDSQTSPHTNTLSQNLSQKRTRTASR